MKVFLKSDDAGFTLLEALIAVMLSSIILLLLCTSIQQLNKINLLVIADGQSTVSTKLKVKGSRQIEWHLFLNQLEKYLAETELVSSSAQTIIVKEKNDRKIMTEYGQSRTGQRSFYRSKNNGHNIMLTDIKMFYLEVDGQWLLLSFTFQNKEEYTGRIWIESWLKESDQAKKN